MSKRKIKDWMEEFRRRQPLNLAPNYQQGGTPYVYETPRLKELKSKYNTGQLTPKKYVVGEDDGVPVVYPTVYIDNKTGDLIELENTDAFMYSLINKAIKAFETEQEAKDFIKLVDEGKEPKMNKGGKIKKYQAGGIDLSQLGDIDFSNYEAVLAAAQKVMPNAAWTTAIGGDDPKAYTDSILAGFAQNNAQAQSQPITNTQVIQEALRMASQQTQARNMGPLNTHSVNPLFNRGQQGQMANQFMGQAQNNLNQQQTQQQTASTNQFFNQAGSGYNNMGGLFDLLSLIQFQEGGSISAMGYRDDSPYKELPHVVVDGDTIDMSETGKELKLIPDVGKAKIAKPYSGIHKFPGASKVLEVPVMKKGGKKKKYNYYQEGGEGAIGAQLEVGEVFATPDANIMDTAAREKHKDMKDDLVTDVLGPEDYVFSDMEKMKATRKELEDLSFGMGGMHYKENEIADLPVESKASDILKEDEDEIKLSDYVKRVRDDYPLTDRDDMFARKSNAGNKQSRVPFIAAAAHLNEKKKKGTSGYASRYENKFNNIPAASANPVQSDMGYAAMPQNAMQVPEGQEGGLVGGVLSLLGSVGSWFSAGKNYKDTVKALNQDNRAVNRLANTQSRYSTLATAAGLMGTVGQNPIVQAPLYDSSQLDATIRKAPKSYFDYAMARMDAATRPSVNNIFKNSGSISQGVNYASQVQAQNAGAMASLGMQEIQQNIGLENTYRNQKQAFNDRQTLADTTALNATRANSNQLIAGAAGQVSGGVQSLGQIQTDRINAIRANNLAKTQAKLNRRGARDQAFQNIASSAGLAVNGLNEMGVNVFGTTNNAPQTQYQNTYFPQPPVATAGVNSSLNLAQIQPLAPIMSPYLPYNQNGFGQMSGTQYNPITGVWE